MTRGLGHDHCHDDRDHPHDSAGASHVFNHSSGSRWWTPSALTASAAAYKVDRTVSIIDELSQVDLSR
jgi:hypothetical protein